MTTKRAKRIYRAWSDIEAEEPDISNEQLFARTSESCHCDDGDVGEALSIIHDLKQSKQLPDDF